MTSCRICKQGPHRYSPDHPQHGPQGRDDLMGCVNSMRDALAAATDERDVLLGAIAAHRRQTLQIMRGGELSRMHDHVLYDALDDVRGGCEA